MNIFVVFALLVAVLVNAVPNYNKENPNTNEVLDEKKLEPKVNADQQNPEPAAYDVDSDSEEIDDFEIDEDDLENEDTRENPHAEDEKLKKNDQCSVQIGYCKEHETHLLSAHTDREYTFKEALALCLADKRCDTFDLDKKSHVMIMKKGCTLVPDECCYSLKCRPSKETISKLMGKFTVSGKGPKSTSVAKNSRIVKREPFVFTTAALISAGIAASKTVGTAAVTAGVKHVVSRRRRSGWWKKEVKE